MLARTTAAAAARKDGGRKAARRKGRGRAAGAFQRWRSERTARRPRARRGRRGRSKRGPPPGAGVRPRFAVEHVQEVVSKSTAVHHITPMQSDPVQRAPTGETAGAFTPWPTRRSRIRSRPR